MVESAFMTALFGMLVTIFFCILGGIAMLAVSLLGLIGGFIWHLWDNRKSKRMVRGE